MLKEKSSPAKAISISDDAEGEQRAEGVDGAAREVDPAPFAVAAEQRRDGGEDRGQEGERQRGAAEASWHRSVVNFDGHLVTSVSGSPTKVAALHRPGEDDLAPAAEGVGDGAAVGDRDALAGAVAIGDAEARGRSPSRRTVPLTTRPVSS